MNAICALLITWTTAPHSHAEQDAPSKGIHISPDPCLSTRAAHRASVYLSSSSPVKSCSGPSCSSEKVRCGAAGSTHVALTFDDGPYGARQQTARMLQILRIHNVKATFFVLGKQARRYPALIRAIERDGHLLANHSWNHPRKQSKSGWLSQIRRTNNAIVAAGGHPSHFFRPPYGLVSSEVTTAAHELHNTIVLYTVLSSDWRRPKPEFLVREVVRGLRGGGIVVLHDGGGDRTSTLRALPKIIRGVRAKGLQFARLDQLLINGGRMRCEERKARGARSLRLGK